MIRIVAPFRAALPIISLLLIISGCSDRDQFDNLFPESSLAGSYVPAKIFNVETQRKNNVKGGFSINALAEVPYDIKREQVKPALLACIRALKKKNQDCEWITVFLCAEGKKGIYAGKGEYKEGKTDISYGVPSKELLAAEKTAIEYYHLIHEPPRLLTRTEFDQASHIFDLYHKYTAVLTEEDMKKAGNGIAFDQDIYDSLMNSRSDRVFKKVTGEVNLSEAKVRKLRNGLMRYYILTWGNETVE